MTENDLHLVAHAYVRAARDGGFSVEQLIEYAERTAGRDAVWVRAIREIARSNPPGHGKRKAA
jgi:hypothetical protein